MPCVLNLADALQHPDDGLHHGALAQQELVLDLHHPVLHVPFNPGNQPDSLRQEPLGDSLRDVPLIADQPAEELLGDGLDDLPRRVDGEVQLEPVHPAHGTPAVRRQALHGAELPCALGVESTMETPVHRPWARPRVKTHPRWKAFRVRQPEVCRTRMVITSASDIRLARRRARQRPSLRPCACRAASKSLENSSSM